MATYTTNCPCCCPCLIHLARELHGTCANPGDSDVDIEILTSYEQDCGRGEETTCASHLACTHTFGSTVTLRFHKGDTIEFTAEALVTCDADDLAFAEWTLEGDTSCVENLIEWIEGTGTYCGIGPHVRIVLCADSTCPELTLTAHYAEPLVCPTITPECLDCYVDGENGTGDACEDVEAFGDNYTSECA